MNRMMCFLGVKDIGDAFFSGIRSDPGVKMVDYDGKVYPASLFTLDVGEYGPAYPVIGWIRTLLHRCSGFGAFGF